VEWYKQEKLLIRPPELWKVYQEPSRSKAGGTGEGNNEFGLMEYLCSYVEGVFNVS
jgi:hypothetical protein